MSGDPVTTDRIPSTPTTNITHAWPHPDNAPTKLRYRVRDVCAIARQVDVVYCRGIDLVVLTTCTVRDVAQLTDAALQQDDASVSVITYLHFSWMNGPLPAKDAYGEKPWSELTAVSIGATGPTATTAGCKDAIQDPA